MIQAQDLRLGNWLENGQVRMVCYEDGVLGAWIAQPHDSGFGVFCSHDLLFPKPLTEEILLKAGFKHDRDWILQQIARWELYEKNV